MTEPTDLIVIRLDLYSALVGLVASAHILVQDPHNAAARSWVRATLETIADDEDG